MFILKLFSRLILVLLLYCLNYSTILLGNTVDLRGELSIEDRPQTLSFLTVSEEHNFKISDDIIIKFIISNKGEFVQSLYLKHNVLDYLECKLKDKHGTFVLPAEQTYSLYFKDIQDTYYNNYTTIHGNYRKIILHKNESFQFSIPLNKLFNLDSYFVEFSKTSMQFTFMCQFYPSSLNYMNYFINLDVPYIFNIENKYTPEKNYQIIDLHREDNLNLDSYEVSAKDILFLLLEAEKSKDWKTYFKYIFLEELIQAYSNLNDKYKLAKTSIDKKIIIMEFQYNLRQCFWGELIDFTILNTESVMKNKIYQNLTNTNIIDKQNKQIFLVDVTRNSEGILKTYRYIYHMEKVKLTASIWQLVNVEVQFSK